jgi:beta-N-acetylhexosaminidase
MSPLRFVNVFVCVPLVLHLNPEAGRLLMLHLTSKSEFLTAWRGLPASMRAGCLIWPSLAGDSPSVEEERLLRLYAPMGMTFFGRNFKSMSQARGLVFHVREILGALRPTDWPDGLFAIDEEGGRVSRLPVPFPRLPSAMAMASRSDEELRSQVILQAGAARALGINCFFAPVVDVLVNPANRVIGDRSFGSTPDLVVKKARIVLDQLSDLGLLAVCKHFPGHGFTVEDTHECAARTDLTVDELRGREWSVFTRLIEERSPAAVMTCHVIFDQIDPGVPATFSSVLLHKILRTELKFSGLVLSDDLRMNAIAQYAGLVRRQQVAIDKEIEGDPVGGVVDDGYIGEAAVMALNAGCDVILSCKSIVREEACLARVAREIESSESFAAACAEKSWRIMSCAHLYH